MWLAFACVCLNQPLRFDPPDAGHLTHLCGLQTLMYWSSCPVGMTNVVGACTYLASCPGGYTLVAGVCTATQPSTCPSGYTNLAGVCTLTCARGCWHPHAPFLLTTTAPDSASCPGGYTLVAGLCTSIVSSSCPDGYTNEGAGCSLILVESCHCCGCPPLIRKCGCVKTCGCKCDVSGGAWPRCQRDGGRRWVFPLRSPSWW